jgi:hypothetical protein
LPEDKQNNVRQELLAKVQDEQAWVSARKPFFDEDGYCWPVKVLAALAPHYPEAVLIEMKRRYPQGYCRRELTQVLVALAPFLSGEVLAVALRMTDQEERAKVLIALGPFLKQKVLMAARDIHSEEDRAKVLISVAQHFEEDKRKVILLETLERAKQIDNERTRSGVLEVLAPALPREVFDAAQKMSDEQARAEVFASLVSYFPQEIRVLVGTMEDHEALSRMIGALMGHEAVESLKLEMLKLEEDKEFTEEYALKHLMNMFKSVLQTAQATQNEKHRANVFSNFSVQSQSFPRSILYPVWEMVLLHISRNTRPQALADIAALMPVIFRLGGKNAVRDTFLVVQTISSWWP